MKFNILNSIFFPKKISLPGCELNAELTTAQTTVPIYISLHFRLETDHLADCLRKWEKLEMSLELREEQARAAKDADDADG